MKTYTKLCLVVVILFVTAFSAFAVTTPNQAAATPDGRFIYVPDMAGLRIRVIDSNLATGMVNVLNTDTVGSPAMLIQDFVTGVRPYALLTNNATISTYAPGSLLFASLSGATSYICSYTIAANGTLSALNTIVLEANASPRGIAISGNYMYVADMGPLTKKIRVINISNPAVMVEETAKNITVGGSNMNLYGIVVTPNGTRVYVSINHSTNGQVLVYNRNTTDGSLSYVGSLPSCPQASSMLVSPDNTRLFVKILETASPYTDVRVYDTTTNGLVANISKPSPGDHSIAGYNAGTGYAVGHQDADYDNDNAGLVFSPDGRNLIFTHYVGTSGSGMWHYNIKAYEVPLDNYAGIYEANAGAGFHSADSTLFTVRNRIWMLYSGGGYIQSTPLMGPLWTSHYNATSREAVVKWADTPYALNFDIQYQRVWPTLSTVATIFAVAAPTSEYAFLPILDHNASYEVRVRTNTPNGETSIWTPNDYVAGHNLYTLEPVWVSYYNTSNSGATILFGPVKSVDVKDIPFATRYDLVYRQGGTSTWTSLSVSLGSADDTSNTTNNTKNLTGLTTDISYEVMMRSVDTDGFWSDWSNIATFSTVDTPWVGSFAPKRTTAGIEWGGPNGTLNITGAVSYELQARVWTPGNTNAWVATNKYLSVNTKEVDPARATLNTLLTGLTERTTYEVRLRANFAGSTQSGWSNTAQLFTWWVLGDDSVTEMGGPSWVSHYKVASNEAILMCELANSANTTNYAFQYRVLGSASWTTASPAMFNWASRYDAANNFPNIHLTGLTPATTYEARVRAYDAVSDTWSDWSSVHSFYTLEKCWVDWYLNAATTGVYIIWGPEVKPGVNVWGATGYKWRYRVNAGTWVVSTETLSTTRRDDPAKQAATDALSFAFLPVVANTTYEVQMAAVNSAGILGEWSTGSTIVVSAGPTIYVPWVSNFGTTPESTVALWGWISTAPSGVDHYELTYSTNEGISWQIYSGPSAPLTDSTSYLGTLRSFLWSGLTPLTTYEARIKAVNAGGVQIGNQSAIFTFHTYWQPWVDHLYLQNTKTTMIWGPQALPSIDLGRFEMQYKRAVDTAWINYSGPSALPLNNSSFAIPFGTLPNLNASLESLTAHTTYEVRMRAVHTSGFLGDWSTIDTFKTTQGPWWTASEILSTTSARFFWDNTPRASLGAISYRVSYGTDVNATSSGESTVTTAQLTMESLVPGATYYAKVRAVYAGPQYSDWTEIRAITLDAFAQGPQWVNSFLVSSREAFMDWQGYTTVPITYNISYRVQGGSWTDITGLPVTQSDWPADTNPNYKLGIVNLGSNLSPLTTYEVRAQWRRTSDGSLSPWSPTGTFFTMERPWADSFKASTTSAYITWGPEVSTFETEVPLSNEYVLTYRIDSGSGFGTWTTIILPAGSQSVAGGPLDYLWSGLTPNATYEYTISSVRTSNPTGISDASEVMTFHSIRGPWWIDAINLDYTSATMIWENVAGVTNYELQVTTDATFAGTSITTVNGATSYNKTGLTAYTTYYTRVRAITSAGGGNRSDWSPVKTFFTMRGPRWISNYLTSSTQTSATWEGVTAAGLTYEVGYRVSNEANPWTTWALADNTKNYSDTSILGLLTLRTWYDLRVRSHENNFGSAWSAVDQFYTLPSPNNVDWTGSTSTTVAITWEPVDLGTGTTCGSYEISWGLTPEAVGAGVAMSATPWYTMTGLTNGTTYYVKVRARDDAMGGWSDWAPYNPLTGQTYLVVVATNNVIINGVSAGYGVTSGYRGTTVIISGMNFGSVQGTGTVAFGATPAQVGYWKNSEIAVAVPQAAVSGINSITVVANSGTTATHAPSPHTFTVTDGGLVFDDIEGGTWQFATWEVGPVANVTTTKVFVGAPERDTYNTVSFTGNAAYEIAGGVTPYGDLPTENGYNLTQYKVIKFWFKGDGSSNLATFELVESNNATGNLTSNPLAAEVWKYNVPISMSDATWHEVVIKLTTTGTKRFERDTAWWSGNNTLDFDKIKSYQIITSGGNPKSYSYDAIVASTVEAMRVFNIRYIDENQSENWVSIPFDSTGITDTDTLIQSIGASITPVNGDIVLASIRDNATQTVSQGSMLYNSGIWISLGSQTISTGSAVSLVISNNSRGYNSLNSTWAIGGLIPDTTAYNMTYMTESQNENWAANYTSSGVTDTDQLIQSIATKLTPQIGDIYMVSIRDNSGQVFKQGSMLYVGSWIPFETNTVNDYDPFSVIVSNPSRSGTTSVIWP